MDLEDQELYSVFWRLSFRLEEPAHYWLCEVRIGTISRNGLLVCFVLIEPPFQTPTKSFALSTHSVEKHMQIIKTDSSGVFVMSDDFAQNHSDLDCVFVSVRVGTGPRSLPESPGNLSVFHVGTHSRF